MKKQLSSWLTDLLCLVLILSLLGCSVQWDHQSNATLGEDRLIPEVASIIDEQWEIVAPQLEGELDQGCTARGLPSWRELAPEEIVRLSMEEDQGYRYATLCHQIAYGTSVDEVLESAHTVMDDQSYSEVSHQVHALQRSLEEEGVSYSRTLPPNQRAPFLRDLQKLITKTLVLLIAGITYACIPKVIFWGKITAAAAVSVAAGIVATSILSIYRYYKYGQGSMAGSFQEWITDVTTDPAAAYALASSMMTVGKTMAKGPVVTGLIIAVFAIYQVIDMVRPMLKKYNFNA